MYVILCIKYVDRLVVIPQPILVPCLDIHRPARPLSSTSSVSWLSPTPYYLICDSHHVLIGCEGKLTRCNDEPIRVPGAVQGFGVLMVLHDDRITGKLPVRQVSEVCLSLSESSPSQFLPELQCDPWRHTKASLQP